MNLLELFVKIGAKDEASGPVKKISSALGNGLKTAAKVGVAAVSTAATAIAGLATTAVNSFAEFEQLAGGVEKIFDQMDTSRIFVDAQNAYKDFNLSANEYLALINDVGAAFSATMGDEAGYDAAKRGLQAIADYASGTGKNVDELSSKFAMITRSTSSYQSIADQFSGILPATSKDFLKQAQAAGLLSKKYKELTKVPIAEYQEAVSKMLEKGTADLGLTGNTAAETANTISGSLAAMRASWVNLLTGAADENADFGALLDAFTESAVRVVENIAPVFSKAVGNIGKAIKGIAPVIAEQLPALLQNALPALIAGAQGLIEGFVSALPTLLVVLQENMGGVIDAVLTVMPLLIDAGLQLLMALAQGIAENGDVVLMAILAMLPQLILSILSFAGSIFDSGVQLINELMAALIQGFVEIMTAVGTWVDEYIIQPIKNKAASFVEAGRAVIDKFKEGISNAWQGLVGWFNGLWDSLFGSRSVNVNVNGTSNSTAIGLDYVPYNNYLSYLHRGEAVLTATEAEEWRRGKSGNGSGITIVQNIQSVPQTPIEMASATAAAFEQARWAI